MFLNTSVTLSGSVPGGRVAEMAMAATLAEGLSKEGHGQWAWAAWSYPERGRVGYSGQGAGYTVLRQSKFKEPIGRNRRATHSAHQFSQCRLGGNRQDRDRRRVERRAVPAAVTISVRAAQSGHCARSFGIPPPPVLLAVFALSMFTISRRGLGRLAVECSFLGVVPLLYAILLEDKALLPSDATRPLQKANTPSVSRWKHKTGHHRLSLTKSARDPAAGIGPCRMHGR